MDTTAADLANYCQGACAKAAECAGPEPTAPGSAPTVADSVSPGAAERCVEACAADLPQTRTARYFLARANECLAQQDCERFGDCLEAVAANEDQWLP